MMSPTVSIITITYNAADVLPITLKSIGAQTCRDFEHIVIDGASSDDTLRILRQHSPESRILSEPDRGIYYAMNKGLDMARGKYVIFMNAGDSFFNRETLGKYVAAILRHDPDIIYADTMVCDSHGLNIRPRHLGVPARLTAESFSHGMLVCHQAFMVRRELAPQYDTRYRLSSDYDWTLRCIEATTPDKCVNLKCPAVLFLDEGATSKHKKASLTERFDIMRRHFGTFKAIRRHLSFIPRAIKRHI